MTSNLYLFRVDYIHTYYYQLEEIYLRYGRQTNTQGACSKLEYRHNIQPLTKVMGETANLDIETKKMSDEEIDDILIMRELVPRPHSTCLPVVLLTGITTERNPLSRNHFPTQFIVNVVSLCSITPLMCTFYTGECRH